MRGTYTMGFRVLVLCSMYMCSILPQVCFISSLCLIDARLGIATMNVEGSQIHVYVYGYVYDEIACAHVPETHPRSPHFVLPRPPARRPYAHTRG